MKLAKKHLPTDWYEFIEVDKLKVDSVFVLGQLINYLYGKQKLSFDINKCFDAFKDLPVKSLKAVIIDSGPSPLKDHCNGLAFGTDGEVPMETKLLFDYTNNLSSNDFSMGFLKEQGVLCLNKSLTSELNTHKSINAPYWKFFTDAVIAKIDEYCRDILFVEFNNTKTVVVSNNEYMLETHPSRIINLLEEKNFNPSKINRLEWYNRLQSFL